MPKRKHVSWRIADNPQSDTINDWLDQQKNIQESITNIVLHMIDRFGMKNITDYDIQKILYQESSIKDLQQQTTEKTVPLQNNSKPTKQVENVSSISEEDTSSDDDMYNEINMDNL